MKKILLTLAVVLWCVIPAQAVGRYSVSVSTTVACTAANIKNYALMNDGAADVHWICDSETITTTNKAALKSGESILVNESCLKICYATASGTATLRIFTSEQ